MDYNNFASARDFLYLAALFLGAGLGCILNRFRRTDSAQGHRPGKKIARFRNLTVTAGLYFFSGTLAALTAAIIFSNWIIFTETTLYLPLVILTIILALAFRFPKAVGFPLILVSGVFVVWVGYACLRFPAIDGTAWGRVVLDGNNFVHVRLLSPSELESAAPGSADSPMSDTSLFFQVKGADSVLEIRAICISVPKYFPLMGGVNRGVISEIRNGNELIYSEPRFDKVIFPGLNFRPGSDRQEVSARFISFQEALGRLEAKDLLPGISRTIQFEGSSLTFR